MIPHPVPTSRRDSFSLSTTKFARSRGSMERRYPSRFCITFTFSWQSTSRVSSSPKTSGVLMEYKAGNHFGKEIGGFGRHIEAVVSNILHLLHGGCRDKN